MCKAHIVTTNKLTPSFLQAGCPSLSPNHVRGRREKAQNNNNKTALTLIASYPDILGKLVRKGKIGNLLLSFG